MKKLNYITLLFFLTKLAYSQILISPYIVYMDEKNKYGSFIVQNESDEVYEISISFAFGYPISDSIGNVTMKYINDLSPELPSIVNSVRAFPRQFLLRPKQRQVVRMTVKSVDSLRSGTYWARIITSATPQSKPADSISTGIKAQLRFVLNQVTTVLYRTGEATTGVECDDIKVLLDSNKANILIPMVRTGNSPFFSSVKVSIFDSNNNLVSEKEEFVPVYFELIKRYSFELQDGKYKAEIRIVLNEKEDIPQSNLTPISPIIRNIEFSIP